MAGKKQKGRAAWLVTRHWVADQPRREIVAILNPRIGGGRVREFVELLHLTSDFTLDEQASMQWPRHGCIPYCAHFGQTTKGEPWAGEVLCGNDPYLRARLVDDLIVERNTDGKETAVWKDRPRSQAGFPETKANA